LARMAKIVELPRAKTLSVIDAKALVGDSEVPKADPNTGLPGTLTQYVVSKDPRMTVIPHFLSEAECDHLIQLVEGCWMPSLVGGAAAAVAAKAKAMKENTEGYGGAAIEKKDDFEQKNVNNTVSQTRTSWSCMLRYAQTDVVERIEHRVASIAALPHGVEQLERFNMVRYAPGELFNEHHDGKFRPRTVFVYLNDMEDDGDEGDPSNFKPHGDTFFPVLGYSFKPRRGTAVMWSNANEDGSKEDSRMVHAGRAPRKGVKYGVNCFLNETQMRQLVTTASTVPLSEAGVQRVADLRDVSGKESPHDPGNGSPMLRIYQVVADPKIVAVPAFCSPTEVEHLLEFASGVTIQPSGPFQLGAQTICQLDFAATATVEAVERRLVVVSGQELANLAKLRIVRPGMQEGLCNRGCGKYSMYVCLSREEEVFFPRLGLRLLLAAGDALSWTNINTETGFVREEMRTQRVHRCPNETEVPIGIDAYFHDSPLRAQQKVRNFVSDADVYGKCGVKEVIASGGYGK